VKIARLVGVGTVSALLGLVAFAGGSPAFASTGSVSATAAATVPATGEPAVPVAYPAYTRQNWTLGLGSTGTLRVVGSDGAGTRAVTPEGYAQPVWSPDGTKPAMAGSGSPTLAVTDLDTGTTTAIIGTGDPFFTLGRVVGMPYGAVVWAGVGRERRCVVDA
jgi:hypothetical protein